MLRYLFSLLILLLLGLVVAFVLASFSGISLSDLPKEYLQRLKYAGLEEVGEGEFKITKLKVAVMGDSHNDNHNLKKALDLAKEEGVDFVIFVGDFTLVGTLDNLLEAKDVLDASGLKYYAIPGDHDLWKTIGPDNFIKVFGSNYQSFDKEGIRFILIDNSDVYSGMSVEQFVWIDNLMKESSARRDKPVGLDAPIFVFLPTPLYHYSSPRVFGNDPKTFEPLLSVADQRDKLLALFRNSHVTAIFSGDLHFSEKFNDLKKIDMTHFIIGALTESRNLQTPRFSILTIYDNMDYQVEDVLL